MQRFHRFFVGVCPLVLVSLFISFFSCQSSDDIKVSEGALVDSLNLIAHIGNVSSRMGMADNYNGTFSCYWNNDKFNIYQKYVLNGSLQCMMPLEFDTYTTSGTSAIFSYIGREAYRYNPGARLYAFSKGTSGEYTTNVADDGTSILTAPMLAMQDGTLSDCAKFDALYGSASVNYSTGLPESIAMHHLFGMLNLHLTCANFSTNYPVAVTLKSSVANILPGNGGSACLTADGITFTRTGSWNTSWNATITPNTDGVVDLYFMTWPFGPISGKLIVSCSDGTYNTYIDRVVTLRNFSLDAAQLKSEPLSITSTVVTPNTYSTFYAWDATDSEPVILGTVPTDANTSAKASDYADMSNRASYVCKICPSANEISWYLSVDCYWDDGTIAGGNNTDYKMGDGSYTKKGMWFRKKSGIPGFSSTVTYTGGNSRTPKELTPTIASALNLNSNYFFLPVSGYTDSSSGNFINGGTCGFYWSSTPLSYASNAYCLYFYNSVAGINSLDRKNGYSLWMGQ